MSTMLPIFPQTLVLKRRLALRHNCQSTGRCFCMPDGDNYVMNDTSKMHKCHVIFMGVGGQMRTREREGGGERERERGGERERGIN